MIPEFLSSIKCKKWQQLAVLMELTKQKGFWIRNRYSPVDFTIISH